MTTTDPINSTNQGSTSITGTSEPGATISVVVTDGTTTTAERTAVADASGVWSISGIDVSSLNDGAITYSVSATDTAGNSAVFTQPANKDTVAPAIAVLTVTNPVGLGNYLSATASGTGEAGATVSVVVTDGVHTTIAVTATVGIDGTWTAAGINLSSLTDGAITYTATATDASQNSAQSSLSATKTTVRIEFVTNPIEISNVGSTSASGTGQVGATVTLVASDGVHTTTTFQTTIAADGTWSVSGIDVSALDDGTITFTATAKDDLGNGAKRA